MLPTSAILTIIGIIAAAAAAVYLKIRYDYRAYRNRIREERLGRIREIQEMIGQVRNTAIRDSEAFKRAKEKFDAKYRRNSSPRSNDGSGSSDGGGGG